MKKVHANRDETQKRSIAKKRKVTIDDKEALMSFAELATKLAHDQRKRRDGTHDFHNDPVKHGRWVCNQTKAQRVKKDTVVHPHVVYNGHGESYNVFTRGYEYRLVWIMSLCNISEEYLYSTLSLTNDVVFSEPETTNMSLEDKQS